MQVYLSLEDNLKANLTEGISDEISSKSFFKINLRRYVSVIEKDHIEFRAGLSYIAIKQIVNVFERYSVSCGFELYVSPSVTEYIAQKEMHLDIRSKMGNEIKNCDIKFENQFASFSNVVNSCLSRQLRDKQMWDAFYMTTMRKSCNFSVPGSGKTTSVYAMYAYLNYKHLVKRIVVICPKNAFGPWIDEFGNCFGAKAQLKLFNIHSTQYSSSAQKRNAIKYESGFANLLLFNYECIKTFESEIKSLIGDDTLLVFDEVHKVKRIDGEYAKAALSIATGSAYTVAMTGTPIPNSYSDIYNLLHILYNEEYEDFFGFGIAGLKNPSSSTIEQVNKKIQPFFCRTTKAQLDVPPANKDSIIPVGCSDDEAAIFRILFNKHKKNKLLLMLRVLQLESNPEMLLSAIDLSEYRYVLDDDKSVDEIDYADYSDEIKERISRCGTSTKTTQCINLVKGLVFQNKPVIIWSIFVNTIKNLADLLKKEGIKVRCVYGEVDLEERQKLLAEFKEGKFSVLITNPNTLAESVSLHTICHDAVYFEYSFNLVHLLQSKDRIHRLGLPQNQYTQFYFLQTMFPTATGYYSMDEQIYDRLCTKEKIMLDAIDMNVIESMPSTDEELEMIFAPLF